MPNFNFNEEQIEAIVTALLGFTDDKVDNTILADVSPKAIAINEGMNIVKENNCQGCHIINNYGGRIIEDIGKPEYSPPNLNTQGSKTQPEWLYDFFRRPYTIRPSLKVRMPSYHLNESEWICKKFKPIYGLKKINIPINECLTAVNQVANLESISFSS